MGQYDVMQCCSRVNARDSLQWTLDAVLLQNSHGNTMHYSWGTGDSHQLRLDRLTKIILFMRSTSYGMMLHKPDWEWWVSSTILSFRPLQEVYAFPLLVFLFVSAPVVDWTLVLSTIGLTDSDSADLMHGSLVHIWKRRKKYSKPWVDSNTLLLGQMSVALTIARWILPECAISNYVSKHCNA